MAEALKRRYGVESVPEAHDRILALETPAGELSPLVEDLRGRSFRRDERLRERDIELLARRYQGTSSLQIIRVLARDGSKFELDYWCDISPSPCSS